MGEMETPCEFKLIPAGWLTTFRRDRVSIVCITYGDFSFVLSLTKKNSTTVGFLQKLSGVKKV